MIYDNASFIKAAEDIFAEGPLTRFTNRLGLRILEFKDRSNNIFTAIEQNPNKASTWGQLARQGHKVVQIKAQPSNVFVAAVVDGKVTIYS